jgi:hypothetical protein
MKYQLVREDTPTTSITHPTTVNTRKPVLKEKEKSEIKKGSK